VLSPTALQRRPILLVLACTVLGAAAQVLIKSGAGALGPEPTLFQTAIGILTTLSLFAGYSLYGLSTILLVLALRRGQLSILYPVIALTYVWVTILSVMVFHDTMGVLKIMGITAIVAGVAVLGMGDQP
jgi:multidrug transporter EmrE-like cation transporter